MSPIDSPRESCSSSPRRTIGVAPSSATPTSKEIRVRVEGFSKTSAMLRPASVARAPARRAAPGFQLGGEVEQLGELERPQLFAGEEVALQAADTTARAVHRHRLEPLPRARLPARPGAASPGARGCCGSTERNATHVQVNRDLLRRVRRAARRGGVGRGAAAGVPAALARAAGARPAGPRRTACSPRATRSAPLRAARRPPQPRPDRLRRGRLQPDPGPRRRGAALGADRRAPRADDPRGPARAPGDGVHPHRLRALCVANLHATNDRPELATEDVLRAARGRDRAGPATRRCSSAATSTCGPAENPAVFEELRERFGLAAPDRARRDRPPARRAGSTVVEPPHPWPPERRELREDGLALRLSDHAPVEARFATPDRGSEIVSPTASAIASRCPTSETGGN